MKPILCKAAYVVAFIVVACLCLLGAMETDVFMAKVAMVVLALYVAKLAFVDGFAAVDRSEDCSRDA